MIRGEFTRNRLWRAQLKAERRARTQAMVLQARHKSVIDRIIDETELSHKLVVSVFGTMDLDGMNAAETLVFLLRAQTKLRKHIADVLDARNKLNLEIAHLREQAKQGIIRETRSWKDEGEEP